MNLWMENPSYDELTAMHFYSWGKGLKTGIYYVRTKAKASAQKFTIEPERNTVDENTTPLVSPINEEVCDMCSG